MKKIKLVIAIAAAVILSAGIACAIPQTVSAAGDVKINEKNFPDSVFRDYVKENFDKNKDGKLSSSEVKNATSVNVMGVSITSLKGIEYLTELTELLCSHSSLTTLDLSKNTKLKILGCSLNELVSLNISKNTQLTELFCNENLLEKLDISKNTKLVKVACKNNKLKELDVSKNSKLGILNCSSNNLKSIDVSKNLNLGSLSCYGNQLKEVDVSKNTKLFYFSCANNQIKTLDVSKNSKLAFLSCGGNKISKLDISNNPSLYHLKYDVSSFVKGDIYVKNGQTLTLTPYSDKSVLRFVSFESSDPAVATLDGQNITPFKPGTTKITATAGGAYTSFRKKVTYTVHVLYQDVTNPKDFWYEPTYYLSAKDVVKGYDNQTKFKPDNECTRAQMVTFLWRLNGEPKPKSDKTSFKDVKKKDYFYNAVIWAVEKGITTGVSKTKFNPGGVCTRAQTVTFLWRMAGKKSAGSAKNPFKDVKKSDYFYDAVIWASKKKIVAGYSDSTFKPQGKCLRRQMVTFLYKYDKFVNNK